MRGFETMQNDVGGAGQLSMPEHHTSEHHTLVLAC